MEDKQQQQQQQQQEEAESTTAIGSTVALAASCQWCNRATGSRVTIIGIEDYRWQVHKCLLVRRSPYFERHLGEGDGGEHLLPSGFPGGPAAVDAIVSYCLDPGAQILRASNVAAVRCAAEFLGMASVESEALPLARRADEFLVHVALRCWGGALAVLSQCAGLLPLAEELGIVARCVDAIARAVASSPSRSAAEIGFLEDLAAALAAAPPAFLVQIVRALRSKGAREASIARLLVACVQRWLFSSSASSSEAKLLLPPPPAASERLEFVEAVAAVLPCDDSMPIAFLFLLLRYALAVGATDDCKSQLESRISLQLHKASLDDLLLPIRPTPSSDNIDSQLGSLIRIMSKFSVQQLQQQQQQPDARRRHQLQVLAVVAKSWDELLVEVSRDSRLSLTVFSQLIEALPSNARTNHDLLYKAIQSFLEVHPEIDQQDRTFLCHSLNCLKLSQEVCIQAVQNELMPLRMVVQAMFVQQLETRNAINRHLRAMTSLARLQPLKAQHRIQKQGVCMKLNVAYEDGACGGGGGRDSASSGCLVEDLQETSLRLETLEAAMSEMRSSLWSTAYLTDEVEEIGNVENGEGTAGNAENGEDNNINENNSEENNGSCLSSNSTPTSQKVRSMGEDGTTKNKQQEEQTMGATTPTTTKKRRFFGAKPSTCARNGVATRRGVTTRMLNRIGILGLCKASSRNLAHSSFNELPLTTSDKCGGGKTRMTTGCLSSSTEVKGAGTSASRRNKAASSWDDGEKAAGGATKVHARHHSVA